MKISQLYLSPKAQEMINKDSLARQAYQEVANSIIYNVTPGHDKFILNDSEKNCNGVVPIKEQCYVILEKQYLWYREKPLKYLHNDMKKGGPIDVYKDFVSENKNLRVGLEFETGNISSAHRSINKLCVGLEKCELDLAMLMLPIKKMAFYLTDRISNYEELKPYFILLDSRPFIVFGFDADEYSGSISLLPKGKDGMSNRSIRKWSERDKKV